ncbi:MAG: hypothetical protein CSA65_06525 [Proteobacteria bacterium]|nr:MAG: hypothetical protein CSA65_06525 [Pseudomonadota bacterium]
MDASNKKTPHSAAKAVNSKRVARAQGLWPRASCNLLFAIVLTAGCTEALESQRAIARRGAASTSARSERGPQIIRLERGSSSAVERPQLLARLPWGSGRSSLGRRLEASQPGPMSLAATSTGELLVLDQVNRRVVRLDHEGRWLGSIAITSEASEDLVAVGAALFVLVYERLPSPGYRLERYRLPLGSQRSSSSAAEARPTMSLGLSRRIQLATGLFASGRTATPEIWVESRHERCVRVVREGKPAKRLQQRLGRPPRVGSTVTEHLAAVRLGAAEVRVLTVGRDARSRLRVRSARPLHSLNALQRDSDGRLYLGLTLAGDELREVLVVVDAAAPKPRWLALPSRRTDAFRPLTVAANGAVYALGSDDRGVTLWRWSALAATGGAR